MRSTTAVDADAEARSRRTLLVQKRAAVWLTVGLLAVPGVPMVAKQLLAADPWVASADGPTALSTAGGSQVVVPSPSGWDVLESSDGVFFRSGAAGIAVQVYDRGSRDLAAVAERLMRTERLTGVNAALTGKDIVTDDGALSGQTCALVGDGVIGSCAFVADDEVIVWVQVMGTVDDPAPELSNVVRSITRGER